MIELGTFKNEQVFKCSGVELEDRDRVGVWGDSYFIDEDSGELIHHGMIIGSVDCRNHIDLFDMNLVRPFGVKPKKEVKREIKVKEELPEDLDKYLCEMMTRDVVCGIDLEAERI